MKKISIHPNKLIINLITYTLITNTNNTKSFIKYNNKYYSILPKSSKYSEIF